MKPLDKAVIAVVVAVVLLRYTDTPVSPRPPEPGPGKGMHVLWVVETRDKVPQWLTNQTASDEVRTYLDTHCAKDGDQPGYRIYDPHTNVAHAPQIWQDMMKVERKSIPWLLIEKGRQVSSGPPPKDNPTLMTLLKKYGGP